MIWTKFIYITIRRFHISYLFSGQLDFKKIFLYIHFYAKKFSLKYGPTLPQGIMIWTNWIYTAENASIQVGAFLVKWFLRENFLKIFLYRIYSHVKFRPQGSPSFTEDLFICTIYLVSNMATIGQMVKEKLQYEWNNYRQMLDARHIHQKSSPGSVAQWRFTGDNLFKEMFLAEKIWCDALAPHTFNIYILPCTSISCFDGLLCIEWTAVDVLHKFSFSMSRVNDIVIHEHL